MTRTNGKSNGYLITVMVNVVLLGLFFGASRAVHLTHFHLSWKGMLFFMLAGLLTSGFGRLLLFASIDRINPSRASALKNVAPVFTVLFALILLNEHLSLLEGLGVLLLLSAIFLQAVMNFRKSSGSLKTDKSEEKRRAEWIGYLVAVFAALIFGVGQGIRKQGLFLLNNAFFGAWVGALTALCFQIVFLSLQGRLKETIQQNRKYLNRYFVLAGVFSSTGPLCFFLGASLIPVSFVSVIAAVEPLVTILLSAMLLKGEEDLNLSVWITAILVLFGTMVIVFSG